MQDEVIVTPTLPNRVPWNKGKLTGAKPNATQTSPYVSAGQGRLISTSRRYNWPLRDSRDRFVYFHSQPVRSALP